MNPTPPLPPARTADAGRIPSAPGDLPPLNARFAAYLNKSVGSQTRNRVIVFGSLAALGVLLSLFVVFMGYAKNVAQAWTSLPLCLVMAVQGLRELGRALKAQKSHETIRRVVQNGVPVTAYLVQANQALFSPGPFLSLPCLVLFSFQPEVAGDGQYMASLASKVFRYKNTTPPDADGQTIAQLTTDERAVFHRRRKLPFSLTDGSTIYCADLWIKRAYVPGGFLQTRQMVCLAEPGETGGLELVPAFLL